MRLRAAAGPDTRLVTRDTVIPYSCQVPASDNTISTPGLVVQELPQPLDINNPSAFSYDLSLFVSAPQKYTNVRLNVYLDDGSIQWDGTYPWTYG